MGSRLTPMSAYTSRTLNICKIMRVQVTIKNKVASCFVQNHVFVLVRSACSSRPLETSVGYVQENIDLQWKQC